MISLKRMFIAAALLLSATAALAVPIGFTQITNNGSTGIAAQLGLEVTSIAGGANFLFTNAGPNASSICDIYFQDNGSLFGPLLASNLTGTPIVYKNGNAVSGVSFSPDANPGNLPSGNLATPPFNATTTTVLSADSDSPVEKMGINPGEYLNLALLFTGGHTFSELLDAIDNGGFRIGLHVQGIGPYSESFVNDEPPPAVPEPGTILLLSIGAGCLVASRVRSRRKAS